MAKKKKGNTWQFFQMLGKTFMFPIALLSICGMLLGIGSAFTNESMIEAIPFLGNTYVNPVSYTHLDVYKRQLR